MGPLRAVFKGTQGSDQGPSSLVYPVSGPLPCSLPAMVMVSVLWNLESITNGEKINGTYWMHYKADLFAIKSDLKEISRLRRDLGDAAI